MVVVWIVTLILFLTYGCANVPQHELAKRETSLGCTDSISSTLESGLFNEGEWPDKEWWKDFDDPILIDLIEKGLKLSPNLQRAESRLKAAAQVALQKKATLFPEIDLNADDNWQHLSKHGLFRQYAPVFPPVLNQIDLSFKFTYEFDFWGKNRDLFRAALGEARALAAEKKQAELILTTSIAYSYFESQFLLHKLEILEKIEKNKKAIFELTRKQEEHGLATALQGLQSLSMALDTEGQLVVVDQELRTRIQKMKMLTAIGQDGKIELNRTVLKRRDVAIPSNLSVDLLARRPDLTAQLLRLEAAAKRISAAKTDFYPNINLSALVGLDNVKNGLLFHSSSFGGSLQPAFHLPIFTAGRLKAQLFEKVALFDEAVYAYNELILQASAEIINNLTDIALLSKQIEIRSSIVENARKNMVLTANRFEHALDHKISLLDSENVLLENELELISFDYAKQLAKIQLIRSLGGGYNYE